MPDDFVNALWRGKHPGVILGRGRTAECMAEPYVSDAHLSGHVTGDKVLDVGTCLLRFL